MTLARVFSLVVVALACALPASAQDLALPSAARLAIDAPETEHPSTRLLPLQQLTQAEAGAEVPTVAPLVRVSSFEDESRVFWFSAGASAIASLGTRVLLVIPTSLVMLFALTGMPPLLGQLAGLVIAIGAMGAFVIADSAVAALTSSLVYDNASRFYETSFLAGFGGQLAGNALSSGVMALTLGFGTMLLFGFEALAPFTGAQIAGPLIIFSTLGVMPAFVIGFLASVALPAIIGVWALSATARPKEGFVIDTTWKPMALRQPDEGVLPDARRLPLQPVVSVVIPGT